MNAARAGQLDAFDELVRRHQRSALAVAYSLTGDAAEAEDLAQEGFIRAQRNLDLLADPLKFGPWLRRVVFGTCVDWLRAFRPELYRQIDERDDGRAAASGERTPLEQLEQAELVQRVHDAVARLAPRYRVPLTMYHLDGVAARKVADTLGIEQSSVRSLLTRARQRLQPLLAAYAREIDAMGSMSRDVLDEQVTVPRMLHVLNGDATRVKLEASQVPGTFAVWADVLHEGPVPAEPELDVWIETRARHLASSGYTSPEDARHTLGEWHAALARYADYEEVVIWCEHDLFDQLLLIRHLDWFARQELGRTRLSLICIGSHPGVPDFKGLGQLEPDQLASLLATRQPIGVRQLALGGAAWRAFTCDDPRRIERLIAGDTSSLPFLAPALRRHLEELPSVRDGCSRTEQRILALLEEGPLSLVDLFRGMHAGEDAFYIADLSFLTVLRSLAAGSDAAVVLELGANDTRALPPGTARLTRTGRELLAGRADRIGRLGVDRWLGGVHLIGREVPWRWSAEDQRVIRTADASIRAPDDG